MSGKVVTIDYCPQKYQLEIHKSKARHRVVVIGRRGGKTELALNELIKHSVQNPGLYWYVAPSYRQAKDISWLRLKTLLKPASGDWKFNEQELYAENIHTGARIVLKGADNEDSLRGLGLKGVVLDECATMKATVWPKVLQPMTVDYHGWALFIGTPKGKNWFYDCFVKSGTDSDWESWQHGTSINEYIDPKEIERARKELPETIFRQEYEAGFIEDETGVFKRVRSCITGNTESPKEGRFYVIGVDLAKAEDFTVLSVVDSVSRHLVELQRFNEISWREQKLKIQALAARYNNALCVIDSTGLGDPIFEDLQNSGVSCEGFKFTNDSKNRLINQLAIAIEQRQITFPRIDVLIDELMRYEYEILPGGGFRYSAPSGRHDDCVISLGLAVWGIRTQLHEAAVVQDHIKMEWKQEDKVRQSRPFYYEELQRQDSESNIGGY